MVVEGIKVTKPMDYKKVLILGAYGMLGYDLQCVFQVARFCGHQDLDITNEKSVYTYIREEKPELVINAAAFTNVDGCEDEPEIAFAVNGESLEYIATSCQECGARLIHYSTDYVFDGSQSDYRESDRPNPIHVYGKSKLLGEKNIQRFMEDYRIIRTSWLFGRNGKNFIDTILNLSRKMDVVRVVDDQVGKPTYTVDLAKKTEEIISYEPGIYHITNEGICSWFEFARAFAPNVVPCSSDEFLRKAKRPAHSVLVNTKTSPMRTWQEALRDYLASME